MVGDMQLCPYTQISMLANKLEDPRKNARILRWPSDTYLRNCKVDIHLFNTTNGEREVRDFV